MAIRKKVCYAFKGRQTFFYLKAAERTKMVLCALEMKEERFYDAKEKRTVSG
jgi:hypothetical protein